MRRLIYSPKAYVFVRSSNMGGRIYDLSTDVVRGNVTRNHNDLSKAEVVLRNRFKKWLRDPDSKQQIFLPNDLITIWLQRIAGHPIQVFTGYLDSVPYYQAYPGDCKITASCTLKRLAYTWFDPGLDFFTQWVQHMDGWVYNAQTGEAWNSQSLFTGQSNVKDSTFEDKALVGKIHDGGFAKLLNDFLVTIAGCEQQDVLISDLPPNLPKIAANLYKDINNKTNAALAALEEQLGQIMGLAINPDSTISNTIPPTATPIIKAIKGNAGNIPPLVLIFAALLMTNFVTNYQHSKSEGDAWGYGIYALRPDVAIDATGGSVTQSDSNLGLTLQGTTIGGFSIADIVDPGTSTEVMVRKLNDPKAQGAWVTTARNGDANAIVTWIGKALGRKITSKSVPALFEAAKRYAGIGDVQTNGITQPANAANPANTNWNDVSLTAAENKVLSTKYDASSAPWLSWAMVAAKSFADLNLVTPPMDNPPVEAIYIAGPAPQLQALFNYLKGANEIDRVTAHIGGTYSRLAKGVMSTNAPKTMPSNTMEVYWPTKPSNNALATGSVTDTSQNPTSGANLIKPTYETLAAFSANAAFASQFSFPTNYLEAKFLTGEKALMNDSSCLDAAKQFAQASMRNLMSMPDGRYLAFYPDYFGTVRGPYWNIFDIEMTNFGIQLNDEALATHVYVIGDTFALDGQIDWQDDVSTRGVASISHAMMLDSFIEGFSDSPDDQKPLGRLHDAYQFLQHYGARPHKEEYPIIRNVFFEFLLAWQRFMQLWAAQFATEASFTFQPEVMAGGILGFPDHGIQMYCESVTHSFDYEAGFETNAVLSSPALLQGATVPPDGWRKPGFALAGGINTVGGVS